MGERTVCSPIPFGDLSIAIGNNTLSLGGLHLVGGEDSERISSLVVYIYIYIKRVMTEHNNNNKPFEMRRHK